MTRHSYQEGIWSMLPIHIYTVYTNSSVVTVFSVHSTYGVYICLSTRNIFKYLVYYQEKIQISQIVHSSICICTLYVYMCSSPTLLQTKHNLRLFKIIYLYVYILFSLKHYIYMYILFNRFQERFWHGRRCTKLNWRRKSNEWVSVKLSSICCAETYTLHFRRRTLKCMWNYKVYTCLCIALYTLHFLRRTLNCMYIYKHIYMCMHLSCTLCISVDELSVACTIIKIYI